MGCSDDELELKSSNIIDVSNIYNWSREELVSEIGVNAGWYKSSNRLVRFHRENVYKN